jgi:hypothetical protein
VIVPPSLPSGSANSLTVQPSGATEAGTLAARFGLVFDVVNDYGAAGDGVTDDTDAIQAACAAAKAAGGGVVNLPPGTYLIRRPITLASNVTLRGAGRGITTITKPASVRSLMTEDCNTAARSVTVADGSLFAVDDAIHLYDTSRYEWDSTQARVQSKDGNTLNFVNTSPGSNVGANADYHVARSGAVTTSFPLIRNELVSTNVNVRHLTLNGNKGAGDPSGLNVEFTISLVHWEETYHSAVTWCDLLDSPSDSVSDQANSGRPGTGDSSMKSTRNRVQDCRIDGAVRHAVHLGTVMDGAYVLDNEITNIGGYGLFYCAFATGSISEGNRIDGCLAGFAGGDDRDYGNIISGNIVTNWQTFAVEFGNSGAGGDTPGQLVITNNLFRCLTPVSGAIACNQPDCTIGNNRIEMAGGTGIAIGTEGHRCTLASNVLAGGQVSGSIGMVLAADDLRLLGNTLHNWASGAEVQGGSRLVAIGQHFSGLTARAWWFTGTVTDAAIKDERNTFATPVTEDVASVRLVYEGLGDNGSVDPASGGPWNAISGRRWNGTIIHWTGGGHKFSLFNDGVGFTPLN